jgi:hypothetical protein
MTFFFAAVAPFGKATAASAQLRHIRDRRDRALEGVACIASIYTDSGCLVV